MGQQNPALKAYRNCGCHNKTLNELRNSDDDQNITRGCFLDPDNHNVAYVPNVFGSFVDKGVRYSTSLTLVGIDSAFEKRIVSRPSRGFSTTTFKKKTDTHYVWNFFILMDKEYCNAQMNYSSNMNLGDLLTYCDSLTNRTEIFATEFLCCFKNFIAIIDDVYSRGCCEVHEDPLSDEATHPTQEEIESLICPFSSIERLFNEFIEKRQDDWDDITLADFLGLHIRRKRKMLLPYYDSFLVQNRVSSNLVEKRTLEYVSMCWLEQEYPD